MMEHLVEEKTSSDATQIGTIKVTLSQGIIETTGSKGEFRVMETTVGPVNGKEKKASLRCALQLIGTGHHR